MTILNVTPVITMNEAITKCIVLILITIGMVTVMYIITDSVLRSVVVFAIAILIYCFAIFPYIYNCTKLYRYDIILEDDYQLRDILDNYNIIESHGKLWTIEDKEARDK